MSDDIQITRDGGVQVLRLNRAAKKNALTSAMYAALADAIEAGDATPGVAAHVIVGSGGVFSSGNDINDFLATAQGGGAPRDVLRFIRLLPRIAKPVVAGVDGPAVGIGTTLLFHCDLVYATAGAVFATPFLDLGLVPEAASSLLMPQRMGYARAFEMLALGSPFSADRMVAAGLINAIVPAGDLEAKVLEAGRALASKPPEALAAARRLMRGDPAAIMARTDEEAVTFGQRLASPEAKEAFQAFLEKRPPDFAKLRAKGSA
jgi:enoyl-CoA hydratase/carnithine racemase